MSEKRRRKGSNLVEDSHYNQGMQNACHHFLKVILNMYILFP